MNNIQKKPKSYSRIDETGAYQSPAPHSAHSSQNDCFAVGIHLCTFSGRQSYTTQIHYTRQRQLQWQKHTFYYNIYTLELILRAFMWEYLFSAFVCVKYLNYITEGKITDQHDQILAEKLLNTICRLINSLYFMFLMRTAIKKDKNKVYF